MLKIVIVCVTFFQGCKVKVEVLKTEKKGWGLRTLEDLEQ